MAVSIVLYNYVGKIIQRVVAFHIVQLKNHLVSHTKIMCREQLTSSVVVSLCHISCCENEMFLCMDNYPGSEAWVYM